MFRRRHTVSASVGDGVSEEERREKRRENQRQLISSYLLQLITGDNVTGNCATARCSSRSYSPSVHSNQALSALLTLHLRVADLEMTLRESTGSSVKEGFSCSARNMFNGSRRWQKAKHMHNLDRQDDGITEHSCISRRERARGKKREGNVERGCLNQ